MITTTSDWFFIMISDYVVKEFQVQTLVAKAVLHDRRHGIKESFDAMLGFEAAACVLKGFGIKRC
ncbi:hypothetical protein G8E10_23060 [Rhizobiaceae bacterium CRRU44]|uniref:Uncharacterized protein n=1 Tax=Ferranicluibacter rubi TaxID=2715133 RepID=A0AA44CEX6_9HYPH|nr:hypothetical protein [Ferranicluibacter rubi]NHT78587.1 hypothetical protein [Ferranicluibacter rubi]